MDVEKWQPARLIPTSGISGQDEQEMRATSALLAVVSAVREFAVLLLRPLGAPAGNVGTFIEVQFALADGRGVRPDGVIRITRGAKSWTALVEVKTGTADLVREQIESYLDVAREQDFDAVLTISNQIAGSVGVHPVDVDKRKVKKVALHHLSWAEVVSTAIAQRVHRGVSDPDQAWILAELIRYLQHPKSGAADFSDMGNDWVSVREAVAAGTLRPNDRGVSEVLARWDQLLRFAALRLDRELGTGVQLVVSKKDAVDPVGRRARQVRELVDDHRLVGSLRVPNTVGDLVIVADLRANRCQISVDVAAPVEGKALTRLNWLTRQLVDSPDQIRVDAFAHLARTSTSELLRVVRLNPAVLIPDPKVDLRRFRLAATSPIGPKRGTGKGSFIDSVLASIDGFYGVVLQNLRPWQPKVPQLPKEGTAVEAAGIDVTASTEDLAGQDVLALEVEALDITTVESEDLDVVREIGEVEVAPLWGDQRGTSESDAVMVSWDEQLDQIADERDVIAEEVIR